MLLLQWGTFHSYSCFVKALNKQKFAAIKKCIFKDEKVGKTKINFII